MAVDQTAASLWISSPPSRIRRARYACLRFWHHTLPRVFDIRFSLAGVTSALLSVISAGGIISAPYWIDLFTDQKLSKATSLGIAFVMMVLKFSGWLAPKLKLFHRNEHARQHLDELATREFNIIKEIFTSLPANFMEKDESWRTRLSDKILGRALHVAKNFVAASAPNKLQCTLIGFEGQNPEHLKIISRAKDNRPSGNNIRADQTIAYHVALSGKVFVVNDLMSQDVFPRKGLSKEKADYRGILFIPILFHQDGCTHCAGVLTVDSSDPCEFWGDIGDNLATQLMPLIHILTAMMRSGYPCVKITEV